MSEAGIGMSKTKKTKKKNKWPLRIVTLLFLISVFLGCAVFSYNYVISNQNNNVEGPLPTIEESQKVEFAIPNGATSAEIIDKLAEEGLIRNTFMFKMMSKINGYDGTYKSGTHNVSKDLDYDTLMRILSSDPVTVKVLIPEGLTFKEVRDRLFKANLIDKTLFEKIANQGKYDYKFLKGIPDREYALEGYLFPDTYKFDKKVGEKAIINRMLDRFNEIFTQEFYDRAKAIGMTTDQVIILASIIEKESGDPADRRIISGVFHNRLKSRDPYMRKLQSDTTIQYYYLNKDGKVKPRLTKEDTKILDPYNTYQIEGLPPGPICCPSKDAIEAALEPAKTNYYYFVSKGDGTHEFSTTLSQHQAAVRKYGWDK